MSNDHVHPTIASVLNEALGQPVNHKGGDRLAAAVSSSRTDAPGGRDAPSFDHPNVTHVVPPVAIGPPGYEVDLSGRPVHLIRHERGE